MSFITEKRLMAISTIPIALPQTELRRQKTLQIAVLPLVLGQVLEVLSLNLHLIKIITPGINPDLDNSGLGLTNVGVFASSMATSAIGNVAIREPGAAALNCSQPLIIRAPGLYKVVIFNNSNNVDITVAVTGSARLFS